jgi:hypothetical protein
VKTPHVIQKRRENSYAFQVEGREGQLDLFPLHTGPLGPPRLWLLSGPDGVVRNGESLAAFERPSDAKAFVARLAEWEAAVASRADAPALADVVSRVQKAVERWHADRATVCDDGCLCGVREGLVDVVLESVQPYLERLADLEGALTWEPAYLACSRTLDVANAERECAEKAERLRSEGDRDA